MAKRNQFKKWTNEERGQLLALKKKGMTANQIGDVLGREGTAVNQELTRMKLRDAKKWEGMEPVTADNFEPMTDADIDELWKKSSTSLSMEEFRKEVRDEEAAVGVLLGLGFEIGRKK